MELRYVYRSIEDAIGEPLKMPDSPHLWITQRLRRDYREARDIARHKEIIALCTAALGGNDSLDAAKMSGSVSDAAFNALYCKIPYMEKKESTVDFKKPESYDVYFEQLKKMQKEIDGRGKGGADAGRPNT